MTADRGRRRTLAVRLVGGFVFVAVSAVVVFAVLTLWRARATVDDLTRDRQQASAEAIAGTLALGYRAAGGWDGVDVHPAQMLAIQADADLVVTDADGLVLDLASSMGPMPGRRSVAATGPLRTAPITVDGHLVGTVRLRFAATDLAEAETHVRDALRSTVLLGALLAALVALAIALPIATRIVRPVRTLTDAARRLGRGDVVARSGRHDAPGELGELAATFDDMAERLQAHETARRHLAADVAHELRTPLTLLQGSCEEVLDGIAEPTMERFAQMHDDLLRVRRLVDDLGALADADAALTEHRLALVRCDLADVARRAADAVGTLLDGNEQHLTLVLGPASVDGDPHRLEQIAVNLLSNASKYAPIGSTVTVTTATVDDTATLSVADDGPGIAADDLPHVFERFYRGTSAREAAGSGIGLAVVDQLTRAHHGTASVASSAMGTAVTITLPSASPPAS